MELINQVTPEVGGEGRRNGLASNHLVFISRKINVGFSDCPILQKDIRAHSHSLPQIRNKQLESHYHTFYSTIQKFWRNFWA